MSGDVFGNGALLSKAMKLVAAFDHRHIFMDPDPGSGHILDRTQAAMFALPRSSWDDYDASLISEGRRRLLPRRQDHRPHAPKSAPSWT